VFPSVNGPSTTNAYEATPINAAF